MNPKLFMGRKISVFLVSVICLSILYNSLSLSESVTAQPYNRASGVDVAICHRQPQDALESIGMMSLFSLPTTSDFNLGFESDLSGWETHGVVSVSEYSSIQAGSNHWEVWPKNNQMAVMQPSGSAIPFSTVASILNISSSSQSYFLSNFPNPTDFAYIYKDISLNAGQIYYVAWNYVATDYEPFNDASFFTLSNLNNSSVHATINGITTDVSLLGATVKGTGNYSTGSYGSTGWQNLSFKANETSSYRIGFMVFNLDDTALPPVLFVDDGPGIVKNNGVVFEPIGEDPNAPPPPVPDTTPPSLTAGAVSRTSDTSATVKFTTDENGSYYYAVVDDGASAPTINTDGTGVSCTTGEVTITNPTGLSAGAKDIYIKVKDGSGNVSDILKIDIAAFATSKASQTITFDALPMKTYGDADFTLSATASSGLPVTFTSSDSSIASINDATVTIHKQGVVNITASQAGNSSYYDATAQQTLTIQKRSLQVINTVVATKVFDGTTAATLSGSELQGVVSGDDVQLSQAATGTFVSATAGEQKTVTTQFALTGTDSESYTLEQPSNVKGDISKRPITITADAKTKVYGNDDPALTYQITEGSLAFQDAFTGALTRTIGETVGNYDITQGSVALNDNYTLSIVKGNLEITKRPITITADAKSKVYGNDDPALTYQITEGSLAFQDAFTGALTRANGETVGNYDITQGSVVLNDNYTLSVVKGNLVITKRPITITADAKTKVYGKDDPALTYQITEGSLAFQDAFAGGLTRATGETVGNYDITQGSVALNDNYNLSFVKGNLEITRRPITITVDAKTKVYGDDDPALTYQITEGSLAFQDAFAGVLTRATGETVGNYDITQGSVALNSNYNLSFVKGNLEITQRPIIITADAKTKVYGNDDPALTHQITEGSLAFQDAFTGALTRTIGETVGNYDITQGSVALNDNYTLSFVKGNLEITKRPITITADAQSKIYGNADPALSYRITQGELAYDDTFQGGLDRDSGDDVGTYRILQGTLNLNQNYDLTFQLSSLEITPRSLTITIGDAEKNQNSPDPRFTYEVTSGTVISSDSIVGSPDREPGELPGSYTIHQGTIDTGPNYDVYFVTGTLTIQPEDVPISKDNVEVIINGNVEQIGKQTLIGEDDKPKTLLLTVDTEQALKRIDELQKKNETETEPAKNTFLVPVNNAGSTPVKVNLTGDVVKNLEEGQFDVQIRSGNITYNVPAQEFSIMQVASRMNVSAEQLRSIEIETTIQPVSEVATQAYRSFVEQNNNLLVFPPVSFHIEAKTEKQDGTTESVAITQFTNYVNRTIELPANTDPKLVTTGIIFHDDGTYSHVPTTVYQLNGKWYANINSLTNSEYALIFNSVTVPAVANHWSKSMVEDMAARLVLVDVEHFSPDAQITRSEFADYIVRALGLYRKEKVGSSSFLDVNTNHQDFLVIEIAHRYGIIHGYNNGTFQPDQLITRQEAMTMYSRAMEITQLVGTNALRFQQFEDFSEVSTWAAEYVKSVVAAGVFNGTSSQTLSPLTQLTHAESLTAIRNLLVKSNLINQ